MLHCGRKRLKGIFIDSSQKMLYHFRVVNGSKLVLEKEMRFPDMIEKRIGALWLSPFRKKS